MVTMRAVCRDESERLLMRPGQIAVDPAVVQAELALVVRRAADFARRQARLVRLYRQAGRQGEAMETARARAWRFFQGEHGGQVTDAAFLAEPVFARVFAEIWAAELRGAGI